MEREDAYWERYLKKGEEEEVMERMEVERRREREERREMKRMSMMSGETLIGSLVDGEKGKEVKVEAIDEEW